MPQVFFYAAPLFSSFNTGSFSDGCSGYLHAKRCIITHSIADTFGREQPISEKRGLAWYQEPVQGPSHMLCSFRHFSAPLPLWGIFLLSSLLCPWWFGKLKSRCEFGLCPFTGNCLTHGSFHLFPTTSTMGNRGDQLPTEDRSRGQMAGVVKERRE